MAPGEQGQSFSGGQRRLQPVLEGLENIGTRGDGWKQLPGKNNGQLEEMIGTGGNQPSSWMVKKA